jgi:hypothetical protein
VKEEEAEGGFRFLFIFGEQLGFRERLIVRGGYKATEFAIPTVSLPPTALPPLIQVVYGRIVYRYNLSELFSPFIYKF